MRYNNKNCFKKAFKNKTLCPKCRALGREKKKRESLTEEDINKRQQKRKIYEQKYFQKNKKRYTLNNKKWSQQNPEKNKEHQKKYRQKTTSKIKRNKKLAILRQDPLFRIKENMSRNMRKSLKVNNLSKKRRHWENLVGYTIQELKKHLENLFTEGMSWNNYGAWHIDHIVPKSFFKYKSTDDVEFRYCWSLSNLQPLWAKDNMSKGSKFDSVLLK